MAGRRCTPPAWQATSTWRVAWSRLGPRSGRTPTAGKAARPSRTRCSTPRPTWPRPWRRSIPTTCGPPPPWAGNWTGSSTGTATSRRRPSRAWTSTPPSFSRPWNGPSSARRSSTRPSPGPPATTSADRCGPSSTSGPMSTPTPSAARPCSGPATATRWRPQPGCWTTAPTRTCATTGEARATACRRWPCTWRRKHGAVGCLNLLLDRGADPTVVDAAYGGTPLGWAEHGGAAAAVEILKRRAGG